MIATRRTSRARRGQSFIELAAGLIVLVPIVLLLLDLAIIVIAVNVNDTICRDAARAAASGRPEADEVQKRAEAVAKRLYKVGGYIQGEPKVVAQALNVVQPPIDPVSGKSLGGAYGGSVQVETSIDVKIPASIPSVTPDKLTFTSRATFPITFIEPRDPAVGSPP